MINYLWWANDRQVDESWEEEEAEEHDQPDPEAEGREVGHPVPLVVRVADVEDPLGVELGLHEVEGLLPLEGHHEAGWGVVRHPALQLTQHPVEAPVGQRNAPRSGWRLD